MSQSNLYVSSPVNALVQGILREDNALSHILEKGDFGQNHPSQVCEIKHCLHAIYLGLRHLPERKRINYFDS